MNTKKQDWHTLDNTKEHNKPYKIQCKFDPSLDTHLIEP